MAEEKEKKIYDYDKEKAIVIERLEASGLDLSFASGDFSEVHSKDEMISHIEAGDDIGKAFVETELNFLRALKDGTIKRKIIGTLEIQENV